MQNNALIRNNNIGPSFEEQATYHNACTMCTHHLFFEMGVLSGKIGQNEIEVSMKTTECFNITVYGAKSARMVRVESIFF